MSRKTSAKFRVLLGLLAAILACGCGGGDGSDGCRLPDSPNPVIDITEMTVVELQQAMDECQVSSAQLVNEYLDRIEAYDDAGPRLQAMISVVDRNEALALAESLDLERQESGPRGVFHGIPVLIKDSIDVEGFPTSGGTTLLAQAYPPDDAFIVARLKQAGAIVLGKTNLDEFQQGGIGLSALGDQTVNPYASDRCPGGSSVGSAVGVAANFAVVAIGADTQGSIRFPAMANNLCALRPTRGLISAGGTMPGSLATEVKGPMTRSMTDLAHTLDVIAGPDPDEPITELGASHIPADGYASYLDESSLQGVRIGYIADIVEIPSDMQNQSIAQVLEVSNQALDDFEAAGATLVPIDLDENHMIFEKVGEIYNMGSEGKQRILWDEYLASLSGVSYANFQEFVTQGWDLFFVKHNFLEQTIHRGSLQAKASDSYDPQLEAAKIQAQQQAQQEIADYMNSPGLEVDAILIPACGKPMIKGTDGGWVNEPSAVSFDFPMDDLTLGLSSYLALPTLIIPVGFTPDGIPIGFHMIGKAFSEPQLIGFGYAYEQATHHRRLPALTPAL